VSKFSKDIKALQHALDTLEQPSLLIPDGSRFKAVLRECVVLLRNNNHTVKAIPKITKDIKNLRELVGLFYNSLTHYHPDTVQYREEKVDMSIAKAFVEKIREMTSLEYVPAIAMCAYLVKIVFRYEKRFGFKPGTLYNFRIFGQQEMKWVTEKALYIYNAERNDQAVLERAAERETDKYEKDHSIEFGYGSIEEIKKLIDKL